MAVKTRVAFQGGGARLADLLPIVSALQKAAIAKEISITHVSGTSAGSIAAAMLATSTDAQQFITQVTSLRNSLIGMLLGRGVLSRLTKSRAGIITTILRGKSVSNKGALKKTIFDLFQKSNPKLTIDMELSSLDIDGFSATVTDITSCQGTRFSKAETPDEKLFDVIANSCAVPFVFKSLADLKDNPPDTFVDGGVIQNFPVDSLLDDADSVSDMILGFGFSDDFKNIPVNGVFDYSGRLLSASMHSSMEYAKRKVGEDRVYEIKSDLDTFEFNGGISQILNAGHFEEQRDRAYMWILEKVSAHRTSYERVTLSHMLNRVKDIYGTYVSEEESQNRSDLLRIIKIDSLFPEVDTGHSSNDRSFTFLKIGFEDRKVNAIRMANPLDNLRYMFNDSLAAVPEPRIELLEKGKPIEFSTIPSRGLTRQNSLDHIVFFKGVKKGRRTISIRQKAYVFNGLTGLHPERGATDYFIMRNQGLDTIERAVMLFYVPKVIKVKRRRIELQPADVHLAIRQDVVRETEVPAGPGRRLTDKEVAALKVPRERSDSQFFRVGWRITQLPTNSAFGLTLSLPAYLPSEGT